MAVRIMGKGDVFYNGKALKIPNDIARQISVRAAEIIKTTAPLGPNKSRTKVRPTSRIGEVGVYFPPETQHLIYLDQGIKPRIMAELTGKTIPIRTPGGDIIFRKVKNAGIPVLARDENGNVVGSKIAWKYPGVQGKNFIQPAIQQAIDEWSSRLQDKDMVGMLQQMDGPISKFFNRLERA